MRNITPILLSFALLFGAVHVVTAHEDTSFAQTKTNTNTVATSPDLPLGNAPLFGGAPADKATGNVSCFDYYHFGSVVTNIAPSLPGTTPGATMAFVGSIKNENTYPLVGLDLYVKIFRKQKSAEDMRLNGNHLVAQFVAVKGATLDAGESKPLSIEWTVPTGTIPGEYSIATYAMTGEAYNLSGLSFTDDVTGAEASFQVRGTNQGGVFWDKNKVTTNDSAHTFATPIKEFSADEPVVVSAPLINSTKSLRTAVVTWKQYNWDGLKESSLVESKEERVTLTAGETRVLSFTATKHTGAVTYLVADVDVLGTHSILDVRFARSGVESARINFPALTVFPLQKGQPATLFSCAHVVGKNTLPGGSLDLTLQDEKGKTIAHKVYEGNFTSAMMGIAETFTPKKNYNKAILTATLSRAGVVEDVGTVTYDCNLIDPKTCAPEEVSILPFIVLVLLLIACAIVWGLYFKKKGMHTPPVAIIAFFVLGVTILGGNPIPALANTTTWTSPAFSAHIYDGIPVCVVGGVWCDAYVEVGPVAPNVPSPDGYGPPNYRYNGEPPTKWDFSMGQLFDLDPAVATVKYVVNSDVTDGSTVPIGQVINFTPTFSGTDISWNGTGTYTDSPYGKWNIGAHSYTVVSTEPTGNFGNVDMMLSLEIVKPAVTISTSGTATVNCVGFICTVTSAGTLGVKFTYSPTVGELYGAINKELRGSGPNIWFPAGFTAAQIPAQDGALLSANCPNWGSMPTPAEYAACYNMADTNKFILNVPQQTVSFNYTAVIPDNPPNVPTITGPTTGIVDTSYNFTITATDPDGDALHYEIDWDNDGNPDACAPASCANVPSGTSRTVSKMWGIPAGSHTFKARTVANGLKSGWTSHTISIALPAGPPAPTLTGPGSVGSGSTWSVVMTAGGTSVDCDMARVSAPTWSDQTYPSVGLTETITAASGAFIGPGTLTYRARCVDGYGQWSSWVSTVVTVAAPVPALTIVPLAGGTIIPNIPVGNSGTFSFTVQNTGETGSVISGTVSAVTNPPFTCSSGCTYDAPAGGVLGLDAGAPAQTVTIKFTPVSPGAVVTAVTFPGNGGSAPNVTGIGISPLVFAPTPIDFGQVVITRSKILSFRITNISSVVIPAFALVLPPGPFTCDSGCGSAPISAGAYRDASIKFVPAAPGLVTKTMTFSGRTETVNVQGVGVTPKFDVKEQ